MRLKVKSVRRRIALLSLIDLADFLTIGVALSDKLRFLHGTLTGRITCFESIEQLLD